MFSRKRAPHGRGVAKAQWADVGGKRHYYRSIMELRYARFLEWQKGQRLIADWWPEPDTFYFGSLRRGVTNYKPDFKVEELDGSLTFREVKGWMDPRSRVALKRMAKYHPKVRVDVIDGSWFKQNHPTLAGLVPGWLEV